MESKGAETVKDFVWLFTLTVAVFVTMPAVSANNVNGGNSNPSSAQSDYMIKLGRPSACGNRAYLEQINSNYRIACDNVARKQQAAIKKSGLDCDHVIVVSPAIKGTDVSEVQCVVRGGDIVSGLATNTTSYIVTSANVKRLPADIRESRAAVNFAVSQVAGSQKKSTATYLIKAWKWRHNPEQPHVIQIIPVQSQRVCDALLDEGDPGFGFPGHVVEMFCMKRPPTIPAEWHCQATVETGGAPMTYVCAAT